MKRFTRREFIRAGLGGSALLFVAGCAKRDAASNDIVGALVPVVLAGALPDEGSAKATAIAQIVEAFGRAVQRLAPAIREEVADLLALLAFAPTRILVAGVASPWNEASAAEIERFLRDWRASRFELRRSGYRALTQLIQAAWYDNPSAWPIIHYPGPPKIP